MINFSQFFKFMTRGDKALMALGTIGALLSGFLMPCISIAMGAVTNTFDPSNSGDEILSAMKMIMVYIVLVGIGSWIFGYIYYAFW